LANTIGKLNKTGFSWGWGRGYYFSVLHWNWDACIEAALKVIGILLTAVAASLGAPFWFDMLSKLVNIRAVGKAPVKTAATPEPTVSSTTTSPAAVQSDRQIQSVG